LFSLVPVLGTATIWFPASIVLLLMGNIWGGVFLFFYGLLIVSTADNFFRAYFIGERIKMNQLLIFLAVFGGIGAFGLLGVIFGPLILTFFFAFLHIYEKEYDKVLHRQG
ncbi:MAG TPA: AI-2E family transporter, partial [Candidatus Gracilibacteria bacterium]|nr:AI-2E family transporter [Candidatus Gracilibacteria bacterium]